MFNSYFINFRGLRNKKTRQHSVILLGNLYFTRFFWERNYSLSSRNVISTRKISFFHVNLIEILAIPGIGPDESVDWLYLHGWNSRAFSFLRNVRQHKLIRRLVRNTINFGNGPSTVFHRSEARASIFSEPNLHGLVVREGSLFQRGFCCEWTTRIVVPGNFEKVSQRLSFFPIFFIRC